MDLRIKTVDNTDSLSGNLGIVQERANEIARLLEKLSEEHEHITEALEKASEYALHPNELVFMGIIVGQKMAIIRCNESLEEQGYDVGFDFRWEIEQ